MKLIFRVLLALGFGLACTDVMAAGHSLSIKSGDYKLATTRQNILGRTLNFREQDNGYLAIEYQYLFNSNISIGGEYISMEHEYTDVANGNVGDMFTSFALFNAKYHLVIADWVRPYIGVSIGATYVEIEGPVNGDVADTAVGVNAGIAFPFTRHVGLAIDYRGLDSRPEDSSGTTIDVSGDSLTATLLLSF